MISLTKVVYSRYLLFYLKVYQHYPLFSFAIYFVKKILSFSMVAKQAEDDMLPVSVSEVFHLLYPIKGRFKNPKSLSYQVFNKTLTYVEACNRIQDKSAIEDIKYTLSLLGFTPDEIASLDTLLPQSIDEAIIYISSLSRLDDNVIIQGIEKIQSII